MKSHAPSGGDQDQIDDLLLETVVSAHYLVLQMRMLTRFNEFAGQAETELMAEAISRWAQFAGAQWRATGSDLVSASAAD